MSDMKSAAMFLTPGSVWMRGDGSLSTLIAVSNTSLPKKVQAKFPPQAVYLDETGNILTRDVSEFVASRKFYNVNPEIESKVDGLLAFTEPQVGTDAEEEDDDDISLDVVDSPEDDEENASEEAPEVQSNMTNTGALVEFEHSEDQTDLATAISRAVVGYSQEPILSHDLLAHVIVIDLDRLEADVQETINAFDPESGNILPGFTVRGDDPVTWNTFIGAYQQRTSKKVYMNIYLGEEMTQTEEVISPLHAADDDTQTAAVQLEAAPAEVEVAPVEVVDPVPAVQPAVAVTVAASPDLKDADTSGAVAAVAPAAIEVTVS